MLETWCIIILSGTSLELMRLFRRILIADHSNGFYPLNSGKSVQLNYTVNTD